MMTGEYKKQELEVPDGWVVIWNEFYDIDPLDDIPEDDKYMNLYIVEDLFYFRKEQFHLDLGWYGSDNLNEPFTGFMLVLFRGKDFHNCELLELVRTKSKSEIIFWINKFFELVNIDFYNEKNGYKINENDEEYRYFGQYSQYSVSRDLYELI